MKTLSTTIKIGTCSWKYDSWKGLIYSDNVGKDYLTEYAQHYSLVEVDQWFWSLFGEKVVLPIPEVVAEYATSVPENFKFSIKVPNSITLTHHYTQGKKGPLKINPFFLSNALFDDFLGSLEPLAGKIDSLIFQFEYLNRQKIPGQSVFQERLEAFFRNCPQGFRYCIETRNKNFFNDPYFEFLNTRGLYHVFLQGYWMPSIFDLYDRYRLLIQDFTVIRLHGPDRKGIEKKTNKKWDQVVIPKDNELHKVASMIKDLASREIKVNLNVNNHYEGSAPITIDRLLSFLKM